MINRQLTMLNGKPATLGGYEQMPAIVAKVKDADIQGQLWSLYWLVRMVKARQVIELGVRGGDSTRALLAGCMDTGGMMLSIDIEGDTYNVRELTEERGIKLEWERWTFEKGDSVAKNADHLLITADLIFIDTDHSYELTCREIKAWHKNIRSGGVMVFHDTGLTEIRRNGVSQAMFEFRNLDNTAFNSWRFENHPWSYPGDCGLGMLWKL